MSAWEQEENEIQSYQNDDGTWNEKLEMERLSNERIKYTTKLCDVIVRGIKLYAKDENLKIRENSLNFLKQIYGDMMAPKTIITNETSKIK